MTTILITGGQGQLGRTFQSLTGRYANVAFLCPARPEFDLTDEGQMAAYLRRHRPAYVINTGAYTAVDRAEEAQEEAWRVNAEAPGRLAALCREVGAHLFHFSTDYVYADRYNRPLRETDETEPHGAYAESKLAGERAVLGVLPQATILRTAWVYSAHGHNFVKTMLRLGRERAELRVVSDQVGSPTYTVDLAGAVMNLIQRVEDGHLARTDLAGIYNYSNEGVCSWYDFAVAIFSLTGTACAVAPILTEDYPTPARRPHFSLLDKTKLKTSFGLEIPYWRDSLRACLLEMGEKVATEG